MQLRKQRRNKQLNKLVRPKEFQARKLPQSFDVPEKTKGTIKSKIVNRSSAIAEIDIEGPIGFDLFGDGVTAKDFRKELRAIGKCKKLNLIINSDGGDVFEAQSIYDQILGLDCEVAAKIQGIAASAATLIALAADTVEIGAGSWFMIHEARAPLFGAYTDDELYSIANSIGKVNDRLVQVYQGRTGLSEREIRDMMAAETYMDGDEAFDRGFVDKVVELKYAVAASRSHFALYENLPTQLRDVQPKKAKALAIIKRLRT